MTAKRRSRARQDELARRRRLHRGRCPTHGIGLTQVGVEVDDRGDGHPVVECPRQDCDFRVTAWRRTKLYRVLNGD